MTWLDVLEERLNRFLEWIVTLFLFCIFCLTVMLVLLRYGFNSSIIWGSEAMNYLFIYCTALGAASSVSRGTHIRISCFKDMATGRLRSCLDFAGCLLVGAVNAVMGWFSLPWIASAGSFESPVMRIPMWTVQMVVPVGCGCACLFCLIHMVRIATGVRGEGRESSC